MQIVLDATLRERGITMSDFIDEMGSRMAQEIIRRVGGRQQHVVVFAGPELNGAYAIATSRSLAQSGYSPEIYLFNIGGNRASKECAEMRDAFLEEADPSLMHEVVSMQFVMPRLDRSMWVIDGLFGQECSHPLSGGYQAVVRHINEMASKVISIDVPSGLLVDSLEGLINRNIVHATYTLTIGEPRIAFFLKDNEELIGEWIRIDAGFSKDALMKVKTKFSLVDLGIVRKLLKPRRLFASKADCGNAIIFAGSYGMFGAAVLAATGALRGGAGKVTVHSPRFGFFVLQSAVPCAMYEADPGDVAISRIELLRDFDAVAIGPGIGTADVTIDALDSFLKIANANSRPVVLDADALNCISYRQSMLNHIPVMSILTPHEGEFDRIFGTQPSSYARLMKAVDEAKRRSIFIVLKGRYSAIVWPDGRVYFNPTGSPALATGGTGDVLTGVICAFLAQGLPPEQAAIVAAYVHGLAGELAERDHGVFGTTASDVAERIGRAIKTVVN